MAIQWLFFLTTGNVPELETEPLAIGFHLAAELANAVALILAGTGLLRGSRRAPGVTLLALGMLLYAIINSAGYFAELGVWLMVAMFGVLLVLTLLSVSALIRGDAG